MATTLHTTTDGFSIVRYHDLDVAARSRLADDRRYKVVAPSGTTYGHGFTSMGDALAWIRSLRLLVEFNGPTYRVVTDDHAHALVATFDDLNTAAQYALRHNLGA